MNIALPALIVFLVLIPGFVVRSRFKRAERASLDYSPFGQVVTEAVLWAFVLHAAWLYVADASLGRRLQVGVFLKLMSSDGTSQARAIDGVAASCGWVVAYFASLMAFAYVAPALARGAISRWRWDRAGARFSWLLRFHRAPWYYLLTGADFSENDRPDLLTVSAVVEVSGEAVIYTGVLAEFFVDQDGNLDRLILEGVMRRSFSRDKNADSEKDDFQARFYPVDGDYFVLRYSEAITINVQYVKLKRDEKGDVNDKSNVAQDS